MDKDQSPQFQSLQGFNKLVWGERQQLLTHLKELFEICVTKSFKNDEDPRYQTIRILDTFLSDSFTLDMMEKIIGDSKTYGYKVKILLLNPFSIFAESRAKALDTNAAKEINSTLFRLREAIAEVRGKHGLSKRGFETRKKDPQFLLEQLTEIQKFDEFNVEIKFYALLTDTPIYLISQFAMKGFILYNRSSIKNPWMIFVDDPSQKDDLFDHFSRNFDDIWYEAKKIPTRERDRTERLDLKNVFISHGRNELVKSKIEEYVKKEFNLEPILFEREAKYGKGILENLENLTAKCFSAIIIITREDEQRSGDVRGRQNVIHELGYCLARYGRENVAVLIEKDTEVPSNILGIHHIPFERDNLGSCFIELSKNIEQFVKE